jgi:hypothetical protein
MPVRSQLLSLTSSVVVGVTTDVYTVPAGRTAVVRRWSIVNVTGETRRVLVSVRRGATLVRIAAAASLANDGVLAEVDGGLVLNPGDSFAVFHSGTGTHTGLNVALSGSLLDSAPV